MASHESSPTAAETVAVIDIGASAVRLVVAELCHGQRPFVVEEASRGVSLGKDTFSSGRIGTGPMEAAVQALEGFKRIMDGYAVQRYRAVATSAVREAINSDTFLDRVNVRTGLQVEIIDGSEESRLVYLAVRNELLGHPALAAPHTLLVEVGGGSADITVMERDRPKYSGIYALGSVRMRQSLGRWSGNQERRIRMLSRHIGNVIADIRREMPLESAAYMIAFGHDIRFAAQELIEAPESSVREVGRDAFLEFCARIEKLDEEQINDRYSVSPVDAETLVPALMVYRALLLETKALHLTVPQASLRAGVLVDLAGPPAGEAADLADFSQQVLASAETLGEKYHYDAKHAHAVALLAVHLFDDLKHEHGLSTRDRLLLEVAALLHDIGVFVGLRAHHKHTQYLIESSEIFGLSADDRAIIANVARYHRRALPQKAHMPLISLDRQERVRVNKMAALLRIANALDAEHGQKIASVRVATVDGTLLLDVSGTGDLTMERMAVEARADLFREVFGREIQWRGAGVQS